MVRPLLAFTLLLLSGTLAVVQQALQCGDDERRGLAGAGLRTGDQIVSRQCERYDRALDRPRFLEAEIPNAFEQAAVEIQGGEGDRRDVARGRLECRRVRV